MSPTWGRVRKRHRFAFAFALVIAASLIGPPASAQATQAGKVIDVYPGNHALTKALKKAKKNDELVIHSGTYDEAVTITTDSLQIIAAGDGPVTIDGGCATPATITIDADRTQLSGQGQMTVVGGQLYEIDVEGIADGSVAALTVSDSCGTADYGINVFDTGHFSVVYDIASGFGDSGIYIGGITTPGAEVLVARNEVFGSERGIIVEDSAGARVRLIRNDLHDNISSGIHLTNSDGVFIAKNTARDDGVYGIDLDAASDGNTVQKNTARGNTFDLANLGGTGNCFTGNHYTTHQGDIGC